MPNPPGAIGQFEIGVSAIGDAPFNWQATVLSQYAASPIIMAILQSTDEWLDVTEAISNFFDLVWNVDTAQGWGLDVWGRIVGVGRALNVSERYLGFEEGGTFDYDPFNQSPLYSGPTSTGNFLLTDSAFRVLILAKAFANICDGTAPQINRILTMLFGRSGECYVVDGADMTMTYTFLFTPSPVEKAIITQSGVLPNPTGVTVFYSVQ